MVRTQVARTRIRCRRRGISWWLGSKPGCVVLIPLLSILISGTYILSSSVKRMHVDYPIVVLSSAENIALLCCNVVYLGPHERLGGWERSRPLGGSRDTFRINSRPLSFFLVAHLSSNCRPCLAISRRLLRPVCAITGRIATWISWCLTSRRALPACPAGEA